MYWLRLLFQEDDANHLALYDGNKLIFEIRVNCRELKRILEDKVNPFYNTACIESYVRNVDNLIQLLKEGKVNNILVKYLSIANKLEVNVELNKFKINECSLSRVEYILDTKCKTYKIVIKPISQLLNIFEFDKVLEVERDLSDEEWKDVIKIVKDFEDKCKVMVYNDVIEVYCRNPNNLYSIHSVLNLQLLFKAKCEFKDRKLIIYRKVIETIPICK